ncbi:hypothetical protein [Cupriavidus oxalaticus]|uniref:hypothetical protein n=1 Tax=Cupriavidus oxalaticus TaxID=96344 RepID=UPI001F0CF1B4|nr:hypothetical protein [Cupriavidus oxalaticus]
MIRWPSLILLGDSVWLVPIALAIALALVAGGARRRALVWLVSFGCGAVLVGAAKLVFDYGGWYAPTLGLYSVSGHAMLTTATYPVLLMLLGSALGPVTARVGWFAGLLIALAMAEKLVSGQYHTVAETLLGTAVGLVVACVNADIRVRRPAPQLLLVAGLSVGAIVLVGARELLYPIRAVVSEHVVRWHDGTVRHYRLIDTDPVTGRTRVTVYIRPRLPALRRRARWRGKPGHPSLDDQYRNVVGRTEVIRGGNETPTDRYFSHGRRYAWVPTACGCCGRHVAARGRDGDRAGDSVGGRFIRCGFRNVRRRLPVA